MATIPSILGGILCVVCSFPLNSQEKSTSVPHETLYQKALAATADAMTKEWGNIDETCCVSNSQIRTDYHHLIIERNEITEGFPARLGDHEFEYLDARGLSDRYRRLGKEFSFLRVYPMRETGGNLKIQISVFWFTSKKNKATYAFSDWSEVEFRYDCEKHEWVIANVKLGGI